MPRILAEEHHHYGIDCTKALWCTGEIHNAYHSSGIQLHDADFAIETESHILLVEYKNALVPEAISHIKENDEYNPTKKDKFEILVRKYYDSIHYLRMSGKEKTTQYIFVVEYPKGDSTTRKALRNKLKKQLPFRLHEKMGKGKPYIDEVAVLSIDEWNKHPKYSAFPIVDLNM